MKVITKSKPFDAVKWHPEMKDGWFVIDGEGKLIYYSHYRDIAVAKADEMDFHYYVAMPARMCASLPEGSWLVDGGHGVVFVFSQEEFDARFNGFLEFAT